MAALAAAAAQQHNAYRLLKVSLFDGVTCSSSKKSPHPWQQVRDPGAVKLSNILHVFSPPLVCFLQTKPKHCILLRRHAACWISAASTLSLKLSWGQVYQAAFEGMITQTLLKNGVPGSQRSLTRPPGPWYSQFPKPLFFAQLSLQLVSDEMLPVMRAPMLAKEAPPPITSHSSAEFKAVKAFTTTCFYFLSEIVFFLLLLPVYFAPLLS